MTAPFKLGITGYIGMGKSTVSSIFSEKDIPVWDADKVSHKIYEKDGSGYKALTIKFPQLENDNGIDRNDLSEMLQKKLINLKELESIIHPLLLIERERFVTNNLNQPLIVFDIPLLFETKADSWLDAVMLVTCSKKNQMERLRKRKNYTEEKVDLLIARQNKCVERKRKPTYIIDTNKNYNDMQKDVLGVLNLIKDNLNAKRNSS